MPNDPPRRDAGGWQPLNPNDRALFYVDRALRGMGYPGFETQMLVFLSGGVDADRLQAALDRLCQRHETLTARLESTDGKSQTSVAWRLRPGARCTLHQTELTSSDDAAVFDRAGQLLSTSNDPHRTDPIRFHLLRRPDGRDVFLAQYNHVLMDNNATGRLLREIDTLARSLQSNPTQTPLAEPHRVLERHLSRYPRSWRREALQRAIDLQGRALRGRAVILGAGTEHAVSPPTLRIATRSLSEQQTRAFHQRVLHICGFPSLSMATLGCVFRTIERLAPADRKAAGRKYVVGIGLDLNLRRRNGPFFQNLLSLVPIHAPAEQLGDRDELIRSLSRQFRKDLEQDIDLGVLQLTTLFSRRPRYIEWVVEHLVRYGYSLWYAYFGSLDAVGREFCGVEIDRVCYTGPTWSPMGITLLVNQFAGRMHFQATYDPQLVSDSLANTFLETTLADLPT
jgi:hypothetical protein